VRPGLSIFFFWPALVGTVLPFILMADCLIVFNLYYCSAD
jgi:hypothetical protein